ncbi:MAG: recombinase RecB [Candidatus Nezhaarchaeota archaeon]|nr:recombinase RecB [Candidatus Nezhaarchaeota archaeon]
MNLRRGLSSERIAMGILERLNFKVVDTRKKIVKDEVEVGEVDIVALSPEGELYAVEVKAGRANVSDIRQAYTGALLLGMRPLIVCKGLADAAAEAVAKELDVKVLSIPEYHILFEVEDLESAVRAAVQDVLDDLTLFAPLPKGEKLKKKDLSLLRAVASSSSMDEAASRLKVDVRGLWHQVNELRSKGILRGGYSYEKLRIHVKRLLAYLEFEERLKRLDKRLKKIEALLEELKGKVEH